MSLDSTIITALLTVLTAFATVIFFRKYVPKLELSIAMQRIDVGAFVATLFVRNVGHVMVGTHWCSLRVRRWDGAAYAETTFDVAPLLDDGRAKVSSGCANWWPPEPDEGDVWKLDTGETLTIPFVIRCTESPASLLLDGAYCSRVRIILPVWSYRWKRLLVHDPTQPQPAIPPDVAHRAASPIG